MFKEIVLKNRSYRRFYEEKRISMEELKDLVELARNTPSGANRQPLKYKLVCDEKTNEFVFETLAWAGYFKDWDGPQKGERPSAYIVMLTDKENNPLRDEGIAGQTILLGAADKGMGGCFIGNVDREKLSKTLMIPDNLKIELVIALGYPKEEVVIEDIPGDGDIHYYRDEDNVHHVPKKRLEDILI